MLSFRPLCTRPFSGTATALAAAALVLPAAACTDAAAPEEQAGELTDVPQSVVKRQSIGNCWVYATVGWAESLRLAHSGEQLNLSESWISYWHWFEQVAGAPQGLTAVAFVGSDGLATGGWFGVAGELMLRYGVVAEGAFIPEEAEAIRSDRQKIALDALNAALKPGGALATATARKDRRLVRKEFDKAWQLKPEVTAAIDAVFGADGAKSLASSSTVIPGGSPVVRPAQIEVGRALESGVEKKIMLADAIGKAASSFDVKRRTGKYAWNEEFYPTSTASRRTFLQRFQKALHARQPVIMTWFVDFAAMGGDKAFRAAPAAPGRQGGHMTVVEDYEVDEVPGFGTLKAGVLVTDRKALAAALDTRAKLKFVRIKNSWGADLAPQQAADEFKGYHDLYLQYLNGPLTECTKSGDDACGIKSKTAGLRAFVLPPANFLSGATSTCHDECGFGGALKTTCSPCAQKVCAADKFCCDAKTSGASWDAQCVQAAATLCQRTCAVLGKK